MNDGERDAYVRAALVLQGYDFDESRVARIVAQFARIEAIAASMNGGGLPPRAEPAETFRP